MMPTRDEFAQALNVLTDLEAGRQPMQDELEAAKTVLRRAINEAQEVNSFLVYCGFFGKYISNDTYHTDYGMIWDWRRSKKSAKSFKTLNAAQKWVPKTHRFAEYQMAIHEVNRHLEVVKVHPVKTQDQAP